MMNRDTKNITVEEVEQFRSGKLPPGYTVYEKPGTADAVAHCHQESCV